MVFYEESLNYYYTKSTGDRSLPEDDLELESTHFCSLMGTQEQGMKINKKIITISNHFVST